jgi:hypothetical protein
VVVSFATIAQQKPNIFVIFGDDVGVTNISAYSHGLMDMALLISIALAEREQYFYITMASKVAPLGVRHFSPGNISFAQA